ncbi:MAG: DUF1573 domain-containing protein [Bacteroidales bacterium]|nr:DUF1573 domain-containing protein [Bacteroidales bacterium]
MKLLYIYILISFTIISCTNHNKTNNITTDLINNPITAEGESDTSRLPKILWKETKHDLGVLIQGEKASYVFKFKNIGKSALVISSVSASCGCTVANYDKNPIEPGQESGIEVIFDSSGRSGHQSKTITIIANTQPNRHELYITAEVVAPEQN